MLFILRKIRRSFFLPGKVRTYVAYAAGEILLIVVGILVAVQISEWNQARKDHAAETEILLRLRTDFLQNQQSLQLSQSQWEDISMSMRALLEIVGTDPDRHPDELVHHYMGRITWLPDFQPNTGTVASLISSGNIILIRNEELNFKLNSWPSTLSKYNYYVSGLRDVRSFMYSLLDHYQFRNSLIGGKEFGMPEPTGPSHFPYDQRKLLSLPQLENAAEFKRLDTESVLLITRELNTLQQEILDLIDAELEERGELSPLTSQ